MKRYITLDNETGGLDDITSLLTSYLGVFDENFKLVGDLYLYMKPDDGNYVVTGEGLGINKIDIAKHEAIAIPYKEAKTKLYNFLREMSANGKTFLTPVGQNVTFDISGLQRTLMTKKTWDQFVSYRVRDTGVIAGALQDAGILPATIKGNLRSLLEYYKIDVPADTLHDAKVDALATMELYRRMLEDLKRVYQYYLDVHKV